VAEGGDRADLPRGRGGVVTAGSTGTAWAGPRGGRRNGRRERRASGRAASDELAFIFFHFLKTRKARSLLQPTHLHLISHLRPSHLRLHRHPVSSSLPALVIVGRLEQLEVGDE
jgi:hypothetical protein